MERVAVSKLARENIVNGIALLVIANNIECFHIGFNNNKYFLLNSSGTKINEAITNLAWTNATAPNSGAAILINIKALPQTAPRRINNAQYLISILKLKKTPNKIGGYELIYE